MDGEKCFVCGKLMRNSCHTKYIIGVGNKPTHQYCDKVSIRTGVVFNPKKKAVSHRG